jgi:hypothetical protein
MITVNHAEDPRREGFLGVTLRPNGGAPQRRTRR